MNPNIELRRASKRMSWRDDIRSISRRVPILRVKTKAKNAAYPLRTQDEDCKYLNDTDLVQACLAGDPSAWEELLNRYGRLVYSIPLRYGLSRADADDVFQNVFTIAVRQLSRLRKEKLLAAWLITIAVHESGRVGKLNRAIAELDESIEDDGTPPPELAEQWEKQHLVHQALDRLGQPCREFLVALYLEPGKLSYEKLAKRLGIAIGSIGPTRARCFKKLEAILLGMGVDFGT